MRTDSSGHCMHLHRHPGGPLGWIDHRVPGRRHRHSAPFTPDAGGYWCFAAYYSGDATHSPSSDTSTDGCFDVPPTITSADTTTFIEGAAATPIQVTSVGGYGSVTYSEKWGHFLRG